MKELTSCTKKLSKRKFLTQLKVILFKYFLPEYAFMPWMNTTAVILGKGFISYPNHSRWATSSQKKIYFFNVVIDGIEDTPEASYTVWEIAQLGYKIGVKYRYSRIHKDVLGGRELRSYIPLQINFLP